MNLFQRYGGSIDSDVSLNTVTSTRPYATDIDIGSGQLWTPFKTLCNLVNTTIKNPSSENFALLAQEMRRYKNHFQSKQLLTSRARNTIDCEELKKSVTEPIHLIGYDGGKMLPEQLVKEAILISEIFDINEFLALDLLVTGEAEMENYPCWARGLVAVYIYFEGQFSIVSVLRTMLQMCPGNTWGSKAHPKLIELFTSLLDNILSEDFMDKALNLIEKFEPKKQMATLEKHLGLGDWRHRTQVLEFITSIREALAEIVFVWSAQRGLSWADSLRILEYLKSHIRLAEDFKIGKEDISLLSAVLYSMDFNLNVEKFDKTFLTNIRKYYKDNIDSQEFLCPEILDLVKLSYHVASHKRVYETTVNSIGSSTPPDTIPGLLGDEVLDFKTDVFNFLKRECFWDKKLYSEESILRLFHQLFSDFIIYMPTRLKEFKNKSIEAAKLSDMYQEQGLKVPNEMIRVYENFLEALGVLYNADLSLELGGDYFRSDPALGALSKLVRTACVDSMALFVPNVKMLGGLGASYPTGVLELINQPGHNLSLDSFFDSMVKFLKTVGSQHLGEANFPSTHSSVYQTDIFQRVVMHPAKLKSKEIAGICAYLKLLKNICTKSVARRYFSITRRHWFHLILISAKEKAFPREIRIELLDLAAAMIDCEVASTDYIMSLWELFYTTRLVERGTPDLREELEEREARLESYGMTINFLKLIDALVEARFTNELYPTECDISQGLGIDGNLLEPYIVFVRESVFQRVPYRSYKDIKERWTLTKLSLRIISNLLDYVPHLMIQMLCDSPLLRGCLAVLTDCARVRSLSTGSIPHVDECSLACLTLIGRVHARQTAYIYRRDLNAVEYNVVLFGIEDLLMKVHPDTGRPEVLIAIMKFIDKLNPEGHRDLALQILAKMLASESETDAQMYNVVAGDPNLAAILKNTFIECLCNEASSEEVRNDILELLRSSVVHPSPNFGFFMLGIEKRIEFQQPGVNGYPRTVLHALMDNLMTLPKSFQTLHVLIRDPRLNGPLIRFLRTNQIFVKFYMEHLPNEDMDVEALGYFLKCLALELKSTQVPGALTHTLIGKYGNRFVGVLNKIQIEHEEMELKNFEFFDNDQIVEAFRKCEYVDRQFKVKLVDYRKLDTLLRHEISQLDRATQLRLRKSIQGEAKEIIAFVIQRNEARRREASKVYLFDCWRQCLEILVLSLSSVRLAGVQYVASMLQLLTEKAITGNATSEMFQRLVAETTTTLCAVLNVFPDDLSEDMLSVIILHLCTWVTKECSPNTRALLYSSLLYLMNFTKNKPVDGSIHSSFAAVIDSLCKDGQNASDIGRMQAMYLLGEIIRWNMSKGLGGVVPTASAQSMKEQLDATKQKYDLDAPFNRDSILANQTMKSTADRSGSILMQTQLNQSLQNGSILGSFTSPRNKSVKEEPDKTVLSDLLLARTTRLIHSTESALMTHLHSRGFLKNIIFSLSADDDSQLVHLFSPSPSPAHLRAMLVYESKMFFLSRYAATGPASTQLMLDSQLMRSLLDMQVFYCGLNLDEDRSYHFYNKTSQRLKRAPGLSSQMERLDNLYASVLMLFHSMLETKPKCEELIPGIWKFITAHDASLANLVIYPTENETPGESLFLITSLLVLVAYETPGDSFNPRSLLFNKFTAILRDHVLSSGQSSGQLHLIRDVMLFFFKYSVRRSGIVRPRGEVICEPILSPKIEYSTKITPTTIAIDLSVGLLLKVIHDTAKLAYQQYDKQDQRTSYLVEIIETGLTIVYWHVEMILKDMFSTIGDFRRDQHQFQMDLRNTIEDAFMKDVFEAIEIFSNDVEYMKTMLMNIRRLAHLQKY